MKKYCILLVLVLCVPALAFATISNLGGGTRAVAGTIPTQAKDTSEMAKKIKGDRYVSVCNDRTSPVEIYVGGAGMSALTGMLVEPGLCWFSGERLAQSVGVWVVTATGTATIRVMEAQ